MQEYGYAGKILTLNLSTHKSSTLDTSDFAPQFIGGRGLGAKLFQDIVPSKTGAMEPENCLICATGPVTGFFGLAGCRWVICGKTALHRPEAYSYGNLGENGEHR